MLITMIVCPALKRDESAKQKEKIMSADNITLVRLAYEGFMKDNLGHKRYIQITSRL